MTMKDAICMAGSTAALLRILDVMWPPTQLLPMWVYIAIYLVCVTLYLLPPIRVGFW